jgi:serine/threonine-protein kinase RsbW
MVKEFQIAHAAELEALELFRDFIEDTCQQAGISDQVCYDLKLAVDEACTNIIQHGYAGMNPGSMILKLKLLGDQVVVTITDFGHSFEPAEPPTPDVDAIMADQQSGGFGLHFIYQTMDIVHYEATAMGNDLRFVKNLRPAVMPND